MKDHPIKRESQKEKEEKDMKELQRDYLKLIIILNIKKKN